MKIKSGLRKKLLIKSPREGKKVEKTLFNTLRNLR